ncbi:uncharacterized protein PHALS_06659 [Plasmopara halstedii]|uniref:RxLR-like protein n=1 Tax=Plasmopara halstedii TaxID=4781 RepID=A0A0P1B408_PLAHL|nr:uncharacterized protein PHALS_06659 [Plasmopara halstedii]CEG48862.1 hypothetical protein PHALS_06659 [Plasmopara halstedii]|eukprot:XP_024585231.1 hypothetical protein PHALS_06659 [Plasmopara halstedii]
MKLLRRLIVSAAWVAAFELNLAANTAAEDTDVTSKTSKDFSTSLRGAEHYINAELHPLLEETEPALSATKDLKLDGPAVVSVPVNGDNLIMPAVSSAMHRTENGPLLNKRIENTAPVQSTPEDCEAEYSRHLRSSIIPDPVTQMYFEQPNLSINKETPPARLDRHVKLRG